jgi:polyphosphate kinase
MKQKVYFDREQSWLEFNQRVLGEACDTGLPLLERLRFLAISASNLDEFYMVRMGGLKILITEGKRGLDLTQQSPRQQLSKAIRRIRKMSLSQQVIYRQISHALVAEHFRIVSKLQEITADQQSWASRDFVEHYFPILSPISVSEGMPPYLSGLLNHFCVRLSPENPGEEERLAVIPLNGLPRFVKIPSAHESVFVPIELLVEASLPLFFQNCEILEQALFRVTRNADIELREDLSPDLMVGMLELLEDRRETDCIRLEIQHTATTQMRRFLTALLHVGNSDLYPVKGLLDLRALSLLVDTDGFEHLRYKPWPPQPSPDIDLKTGIFEQLARKDVFIVHPYEAFDPVVKLVEDASTDPEVLAIKQVLYRTSPNSRIVEALIQAAQAGKHVTVLVELKARFDEARNITQAHRLEQAGVHVLYGVKHLKTHAKVCLIVRREAEGIRRYMHFGTGNYNEKTAMLYGDVGLLTSHPEFGTDASDFFNAVCGYSNPRQLRWLAMSPLNLRSTLLECIKGEVARAKNKEPARILFKMNALTDKAIIDALYEASCAGVTVLLNVRGICCLVPGIKGLSERITVVSIVGRYLEHARLYSFLNGGHEKLFLSSADCMMRNLDKRIELMIPVIDEAILKRAMALLKHYFEDTTNAHRLLSDGCYERLVPLRRGKEPFNSQAALYEECKKRSLLAEKMKPAAFMPHIARKRSKKQ